jgi:tryptophanyl-tRNA synthetase
MTTTLATRPLQSLENAAVATDVDSSTGRVVTGDRPTGPLHLGHYLGTLANRVRLQDAGIPVTVIIADYQVITDRDDTGPLRSRVRNLIAEYLAAGIDPDRSTIFAHSLVPALNQLMLPFLSLVTESELHRNPTVKAESLAARRSLSGLLLTYPVHQAADILSLGGTLVPVGRDQLPHIELTRLLARRFNARYGAVFDETAAMIRAARTDALRHITFDPQARPQVANLLTIIGSLTGTDPAVVAEGLGDGGSAALKELATEAINDSLRGLRRRRAELLADPGYLDGVLLDGTARATAVAIETLDRVRRAMGMDYLDGLQIS